MRFIVILSLLLITSVQSCLMGASKTFFMPRSVTSDPTFELAVLNYEHYHETDRVRFSVMPFFQQSRKNNQLARYFLPQNKEVVSLKEDGTGDLDSLWFNLISRDGTFYSSEISVCPERRVFGAYLELFAWLYCGFWGSITTAVGKAEHRMCLREEGSIFPGTIPGFPDAALAFNNPNWTAGKISTGTVSKRGADDIQFKLGYSKFWCDDQHIGLYLVGTAPTGDRPNSLFLFEPIWGTKHGAFGVGFTSDFLTWENDCATINWMADVKYRFVFSGRERRSFDLTPNGEWSRYLQVVTPDLTFLSLPAINSLTFPVEVNPRSTVDAWTALHYHRNNWHAEIGYTFWWRQREQICLEPSSCGTTFPTIGIFDMAGAVQCNAISASTANITQSVTGSNAAVSDAMFTSISADALNVSSAEHPRALSNKLYASVAYDFDWCRHLFVLGVSGSYEIAHNCAALNQWALWATLSIGY